MNRYTNVNINKILDRNEWLANSEVRRCDSYGSDPPNYLGIGYMQVVRLVDIEPWKAAEGGGDILRVLKRGRKNISTRILTQATGPNRSTENEWLCNSFVERRALWRHALKAVIHLVDRGAGP